MLCWLMLFSLLGACFSASTTDVESTLYDLFGSTNTKVGDLLDFHLNITVPISTTLKVELFSQYNESGLFSSLGTPSVFHVGSNIQTEDLIMTMDAHLDTVPPQWRDHAVLDFGSVTSSGTSGVEADWTISIKFSAIILNHPSLDTTDPVQHSVTAGVSHNDRQQVWIGQSSFDTLLDSLLHTDPPQFSLDGPSTLMKGQVGVWVVNMTFKDACDDVTLEVYAPVNSSDIMRVCGISVGDDLGKGFACFHPEDVTPTLIQEGNIDEAYNIAILNIAGIINHGFRTTMNNDDQTIPVHILVELLDDDAVAPNDEYWIGIAVETGVCGDSSIVWSAQSSVTVTTTEPTHDKTPVMAFSTPRTDIYLDDHVMFELNITLPAGTTARYKAIAAMPLEDTGSGEAATLTICNAEIRHVGANIGCFKEPTPVVTSSNSDGILDYVEIELGMITNGGQRHDPAENTITIQILAKVVSHVGISDGTEMYATGGIEYNGDTLWVACHNMTYREIANYVVQGEANVGMFDLLNERYEGIIYKGGQIGFMVDVVLPLDSYYPHIEIIVDTSQNYTTPKLYFCSAEIVSIGEHIVCDDDSSCGGCSPSNVTLMDDNLEGRPDRASVVFTNVTNTGLHSYRANSNSSVIRMKVILSVVDDSYLVDGETLYSTIVVWFFDTQVYVGLHPVNYSSSVAGAIGQEDDPPVFYLNQTSTSNTISAGGYIFFSFDMYLTPRTVTHYNLTVESVATSTPLSICLLDIGTKGQNFPCLDPNSKTVYVNKQVVHRDFGNIADFGQVARVEENKESSHIVVDVAVYLPLDSIFTNSDTHQYRATLHYGSDLSDVLIIDSAVVTLSDTHQNSGDDISSMSVTMQQKLNNGDIVIGGSEVIQLILTIPRDTMASFIVDLVMPEDEMNICEITVVKKGRNIPCLDDRILEKNYYLSSSNLTINHVELVLGYVGNIRAVGGEPLGPDDEILIEASVNIPSSATTADGSNVQLSATVTSDENILWVGNMDLTASAIYTGTMNNGIARTVNAILTPPINGTLATIGSLYTWSLNVQLSRGTSKVTITWTLPTDSGNAQLIIGNIAIGESGSNIACFPYHEQELEPTYTSTASNSQMDQATLVLHVTNTGTYDEYEWRDLRETDDNLVIDFDIQVQDHTLNVDTTVLTFNVDVEASDEVNTPVNSATSGDVTVASDGSDAALLEYSISFDEEPANTTAPGDTFTLNLHLYHPHPESQSFAWNVIFWTHLPPYVTFTSGTYQGLNPTVNYAENRLELTYPKVMFSDDVTAALLFTVDPSSTLEIGIHHVFLLSNIVYEDKSGFDTTLVATLSSDYQKSEFDITVPECVNILDIGSLPDCQVFWLPSLKHASSNAHPPSFGPYPYKAGLMVMFGRQVRVSGFRITFTQDVATYAMDITLGSSTQKSGYNIWIDYLTNNTADLEVISVSGSGAVTNDQIDTFLTEGAILGKSIGIGFADNSILDKITFDLLGCVPADSGTAFSGVCEDDLSLLTYPYERGYLAEANNIYVCILTDSPPRDLSRFPEVVCSRSPDSGLEWIEMDKDLANVDFLRKDTGYVYGLAKNRKTYLRSTDNGETWQAITDDIYNTDKGVTAEVVEATVLPYQDWSSDTKLSLLPTFGIELSATKKYSVDTNELHLTIDGSTWQKISRWL